MAAPHHDGRQQGHTWPRFAAAQVHLPREGGPGGFGLARFPSATWDASYGWQRLLKSIIYGTGLEIILQYY